MNNLEETEMKSHVKKYKKRKCNSWTKIGF